MKLLAKLQSPAGRHPNVTATVASPSIANCDAAGSTGQLQGGSVKKFDAADILDPILKSMFAENANALPATGAIAVMRSILHLLQILSMVTRQEIDSQHKPAASTVLWHTVLLASELDTCQASVRGLQEADSTLATAQNAQHVTQRQLSSAILAIIVPLLKSNVKRHARQTQICCTLLKVLLSLSQGPSYTLEIAIMDSGTISQTT